MRQRTNEAPSSWSHTAFSLDLEDLRLENSSVLVSAAVFRGCTALRSLNLSFSSQLRSLFGLAQCRALTKLNLNFCQNVADLSELARCALGCSTLTYTGKVPLSKIQKVRFLN